MASSSKVHEFAGAGAELVVHESGDPRGRDLVLLSGIGILSGLGAYLISQGYRLGEASLLAPFEYTSLPFAMLLSILFFGDWPDLISWVGIGMIFSAGMWALIHVDPNKLRT